MTSFHSCLVLAILSTNLSSANTHSTSPHHQTLKRSTNTEASIFLILASPSSMESKIHGDQQLLTLLPSTQLLSTEQILSASHSL